MTAQLSRERLEEKLLEHIKHGGDSEEETMIRMLLAGMCSEPVGVFNIGSETCPDHLVAWTAKGQNLPNGVYWLHTAPPAPVAVPDDESESEMKWRDLALQFDGHRMQSLCFLKYILSQLPETEFVEAREFLKSGPLPGEEVLRNRIAAMLKAGHVTAATVPDGCWSRPVDITDMRFVVCPDCGNKRCPKANDHRNACSGSNEPGQAGSA